MAGQSLCFAATFYQFFGCRFHVYRLRAHIEVLYVLRLGIYGIDSMVRTGIFYATNAYRIFSLSLEVHPDKGYRPFGSQELCFLFCSHGVQIGQREVTVAVRGGSKPRCRLVVRELPEL